LGHPINFPWTLGNHPWSIWVGNNFGNALILKAPFKKGLGFPTFGWQLVLGPMLILRFGGLTREQGPTIGGRKNLGLFSTNGALECVLWGLEIKIAPFGGKFLLWGPGEFLGGGNSLSPVNDFLPGEKMFSYHLHVGSHILHRRSHGHHISVSLLGAFLHTL